MDGGEGMRKKILGGARGVVKVDGYFYHPGLSLS